MNERTLYSFCRNCTRTDCEGMKAETITTAGATRPKWDGCIYQKKITQDADAELFGIAQDLRKLEALEDYSRHTQEISEADPTNAEKEERADRAYNTEFNHFTATAGRLAALLNIPEKTAREMVRTKRREIMQILGRRATA